MPAPLHLWSLRIDPVTMGQAVERIRFWVDSGERRCRFVVTPNVDHVVRLDRQPGLLAAYRQASMTVADGWPLVRVCGTSSPPLGFEQDAEFDRRLGGQISSARPDILVVGLGFPK